MHGVDVFYSPINLFVSDFIADNIS